MFSDKELKAYREIQAPDELRRKVMSLHKRPSRAVYWLGAAACFLLVLSGFLLRDPGKIIVNGQVLEDQVIFYDTASASGRTSSSSVSVPFELKGIKKAELSVEDGFLTVGEEPAAKSVTVNASQIAWWELHPEEGEGSFTLRIVHKKGVDEVTLHYENAKITVKKEN